MIGNEENVTPAPFEESAPASVAAESEGEPSVNVAAAPAPADSPTSEVKTMVSAPMRAIVEEEAPALTGQAPVVLSIAHAKYAGGGRVEVTYALLPQSELPDGALNKLAIRLVEILNG